MSVLEGYHYAHRGYFDNETESPGDHETAKGRFDLYIFDSFDMAECEGIR